MTPDFIRNNMAGLRGCGAGFTVSPGTVFIEAEVEEFFDVTRQLHAAAVANDFCAKQSAFEFGCTRAVSAQRRDRRSCHDHGALPIRSSGSPVHRVASWLIAVAAAKASA